mgnify:CR=1 FL=1
MKTVKIIIFFCSIHIDIFALQPLRSEKKIPATENFTNDVVYDNPRNLEKCRCK